MSLTRRCWLLILPLLACSPGPVTTRCDAVVCASGTTCLLDTGRCSNPVPPDAGTGCVDDTRCLVPSPRCLVAQNRCVACLDDGDCAAGSCDKAVNECISLPDSCATARKLDLSTGKTVVTADTSRANDDTRLSCALSGTKSNDLVWALEITERRRVVATVTPAVGGALRPVIALRTQCSSIDPSTNLDCAYPTTTGSSARLTLDAVDPGTYYLWVEGEDANTGAFTLDVQLDVPPADESCAQPRIIPISGNNSEEILGDTRSLKDDAAGLCGGAAAPDAVYAVQLSTARRLRLEVTGISKGFQPVLYARTACDATTASAQVGCVAATAGSATLDIPRVEAGTLFLFVDGNSAANGGSYRLRITPFDPVPPPTNDACAMAKPIPMPVMALGTVNEQGDTSSANQDALGCNASGPDLVYQFTLPVARQVLARVTPLAGSSLRPAVYLRPAMKCQSEAASDQVACQISASPGGSATTVVPNLAAGVWYLWVDGVQGSGGPFDLRLELAEPPPVPPNDVCVAAVPLSLASGVINAQGTTLGANSNKLSSCTFPPNEPSPDVVYELSLASKQSLAIDLKALAGSSLKPVATLRSGTCASVNPNDERACAWGDPQLAERAVFTVPSLDAGTYFLWVSGDGASQGPFALKVSTGPEIPVPANDKCAATGLPTLVPNVFVGGDTRGANNDETAAGCGLTYGSDGSEAPDVAFRFSLVSTSNVTLAVTPDAVEGQLFRPVLYVRPASCASTAAKGCAAAASYGGTATLTLSNLAAGSYTAWVDGAGQSGGKFTIKMY